MWTCVLTWWHGDSASLLSDEVQDGSNLASILTFYPDILSGMCSEILSGMYCDIHSDILSGTVCFSFWHVFWCSFWCVFRHPFWHVCWHSISDIFSGIYSGIQLRSGIYSGTLRQFSDVPLPVKHTGRKELMYCSMRSLHTLKNLASSQARILPPTNTESYQHSTQSQSLYNQAV